MSGSSLSDAVATDAAATVESLGGERVADLASLVQAYNDVTEKLQRSHELVRAQVVRLQRELASKDAHLQRSKRLAALGEMAAGIAHEIRNPLGAIHLYASMLVEDLVRLEQGAEARPREDLRGCAEHARRIAGAVRGLNGIVTDVLSFSRDIRMQRSDVDMQALVRRLADQFAPAIHEAGVQVRVVTPPEAPPTAPADPELLNQAIGNLIRNAVQAMTDEEESAEPVLTLSVQRREASVVLEVRDTGPGIDDDDIDRIFNPFFTTRSTGTGLGLAIVHRIVEAHGGAICVHNDGGAVFELVLPTEVDAEAVEPPAEDDAPGASGHGAPDVAEGASV